MTSHVSQSCVLATAATIAAMIDSRKDLVIALQNVAIDGHTAADASTDAKSIPLLHSLQIDKLEHHLHS